MIRARKAKAKTRATPERRSEPVPTPASLSGGRLSFRDAPNRQADILPVWPESTMFSLRNLIFLAHYLHFLRPMIHIQYLEAVSVSNRVAGQLECEERERHEFDERDC